MKTASQIAGRRQVTVTPQLIEGILAAAAAAGVADAARLEALRGGASLASCGVQTPERAPEATLLWLWGSLADLAGGHWIGAELARFSDLSAYGLLGETFAQAGSLTEVFEHAARYVRLVHQGVVIDIEEDEHFFAVRYRLLGASANLSGGAAAAGMLWANANLAQLPDRVFGVRLRPMSAELACSDVGDARGVIADIFGPDVTFGAAEWRLVFDRSAVLAVTRPVASSALTYLDAYAEGALSGMPAVDDFVGLVAAEVRGRLAGHAPTVAEIAKALGFSTRTLQRRLAGAGRTFEAVLDEVRRSRAEALLADGGQDLAAIAYQLGYSQHSAFTRAAVRWFHAPPSRMR